MKGMVTGLCITFLLLTASSMVCAATITLVADDWCPYNCVPRSEKPGYVVEIAREIFEQYGHTVVYEYRPWKRALADAMDGIVDGAIGANLGNMPKGIFHHEPLGFYVMMYFVLKDSPWNYDSVSSLDNHEIGAISGYTYGDPFDEYARTHTESIHFTFGDDPAVKNFKKLLLKRIDIFIEEHNVATFVMRKQGMSEKIRRAGVNGEPKAMYIGLSPAKTTSQEYANILSAGIIEMRKSGRLQQILTRYGLSDWQQ